MYIFTDSCYIHTTVGISSEKQLTRSMYVSIPAYFQEDGITTKEYNIGDKIGPRHSYFGDCLLKFETNDNVTTT
jgi:hypothetical protein